MKLLHFNRKRIGLKALRPLQDRTDVANCRVDAGREDVLAAQVHVLLQLPVWRDGCVRRWHNLRCIPLRVARTKKVFRATKLGLRSQLAVLIADINCGEKATSIFNVVGRTISKYKVSVDNCPGLDRVLEKAQRAVRYRRRIGNLSMDDANSARGRTANKVPRPYLGWGRLGRGAGVRLILGSSTGGDGWLWPDVPCAREDTSAASKKNTKITTPSAHRNCLEFISDRP